ncbi:glycohydrolase toxin TNT-related protein [Mycobacterium sp. WMMD1722]|uniref:glycohydrolase toxin TNT-related protein n=1 Tax=Mycobacterium sp. WMMD1722 TaxID=3404117 RepID=UPI003BF4B88A
MALSIGELKGWAPEIEDLVTATRGSAASHGGAAEFYRSLTTVSAWQGHGAEAARTAMEATASDHDSVADRLATAAGAMDGVAQEAEALAETIKRILDDAAAAPAVTVDESTNAVIPPDTSFMTEEYAAQVAAKVTDLRGRIAAAVADGQRLDADLAQAISTAAGTAQSGGHAPGPADLDDALGQLAGTGQPIRPTDPRAAASSAPIPLDPAKVDEFKNLARGVLAREGVAPDQIEARLDAMVAAAQRPLPAYTPPAPAKMPAPGFGEGFGDRWRATEQGIKELIGQGGPGAPGVLEAWRDLAKSTNDQLTNPVSAAVDEVQHALNSPSAAYYLGEKSADAAAAAPGVVFGGEGALVARAGALDDLAGAGAIPHDVLHGPAHSGTADHPLQLPDHQGPVHDVPTHSHGPAPIADGPPPALPADSPLFDGYDPIPPGPEFTNPDGGLIYPDDSSPEKPYAIPGTVIDHVELPRGTELGRFGYPGGTYLAPEGTPFAGLSLPPDSAMKPYFGYVVDNPANLPPGWRVEQSIAAPWFHQPGGGTQYRIIAPDGVRASAQVLVDWGFLREVRR